MKNYFRTKKKPYNYYVGAVKQHDETDQVGSWTLRLLGDVQTLTLSAIELTQVLEPCSPFEAISSMDN